MICKEGNCNWDIACSLGELTGYQQLLEQAKRATMNSTLMSYYHTYRPQQFADLLGQDHIRQVLQSAVAADRLVHAYLFCGTRGTGKTSTARLLAKLVNCEQAASHIRKEAQSAKAKKEAVLEPCNQCAACQGIAGGSYLDVIEIDAASNRGIEEIRQLQEQLRFKPQQAKKKIFIIDEVHMLTKEAFNALLKTLEEPPAHLLFILATTEAHKLPATILSRCQRFDFLTPNVSVITQYLQRIAEREKLKVEPEAISVLAELAKGSFRDSAMLLEQLATEQQVVTAELVVSRLGLPSEQLVSRYLSVLSGQTDSSLLADLQTFFSRGGSPLAFLDTAYSQLAKLIREGQDYRQPSTILAILTRLKYQLKHSPIAELPIVAAIAEGSMAVPATSPIQSVSMPTATPVQATVVVTPTAPVAQAVVLERISDEGPAKAKAKLTDSPAANESSEQPVETKANTVTITVAEQVPPAELPPSSLTDAWQLALQKLIDASQSSLVAILRTARPLSWEAPKLRVAVQFKFHADQLERTKNRGILEATLAECLGQPVHMEIEVQAAPDLASAAEEMF